MATVHEQLSEQFYRWEQRGRGWRVYREPVYPEPPFVPFDGHYLPNVPVVDDGRKPTMLSSFFRKLNPPVEAPPVIPEPEEEPEPIPLVREGLIELQTSLPSNLDISKEAFGQFLLNLSLCREPVSFELVGTAGHVNLQFATSEHDAPLVRRQLQAYFSEAMFAPRESALEQTWETCSGEEEMVVEFGLAREFMFPLARGKLDPFIGIVGSLAELKPGELGLFQVLWQPVRNPWAESIVRSVTHEDGKPFFVNTPELAKAAEGKVSHPLYAAVVRLAVKGETFESALKIACDMAGALRVFANPQGNELIPLRNDEYPFYEHIEDVLHRQSHRCGMLLNSEELVGFVHLPSRDVRSPALERDSGKTKAAPPIVRNAHGLLLGSNIHFGGESVSVRLTSEQRVYHSHIIGATGTGKSTLLFNLIRQDIENGEGLAVLDPHGDLIEKILGIIPPERIDDVVLVDPSDDEFSIGFNILSAHSDHEKTLLASDLVSVFQRLSTSWGDQMQSVLQNAILAFLNSSRGGTIADLRRFLVEAPFRTEFLKSVSDPNVLYYWHKGFAHLSGNKSIGPVLTRLEMLLSQRPVAHMVSQQENRLDFGQIMDTGKIFLAKLPEGTVGRENSYLLGALLVSKFQQLVMARQAKKIAARRDFWIYIDEFANFITPSMAEILSGARKYRIGLTLAHHELHQLLRSPEVASAVMTHPYTRVVFRVGDDDAKKLADGFSFFEAGDLKNLERGQAICRVERSSFDFNLSVAAPALPDEAEMAQRQNEVIAASRKKYGTPRAEIESMLRQAWEVETTKPVPVKTKPPPPDKTSPAPPAPAAQTTPPSVPQTPEPPKVAEVPKAPASEQKTSEPPTTVNEPADEILIEPKERREPTPGRGGALHKLWQDQLKVKAEALNFLATIEQEVPGGSVDVLLKRGGISIACEISVTSPIASEVNHIIGRLKAGISRVAVVSESPQRLRHIRSAAMQRLSRGEAKRVSYYEPEQFVAFLEQLATAAPIKAPEPGDTVITRRGRKIERKFSSRSQPQGEQRENTIYDAVTAAIRRGKSPP